jgi:hypothetical protein
MNDVTAWMNCPVCNRPLNSNNGEMIHIECVEVAERRQRQDYNPSNSYT